jgi:diaminohydroxyphosphoribosylaminopyrimidine deaminase/5-amino-6-(5-phosphoribosylamino)uracil reductase
MTFSADDQRFMAQALQLAEHGLYTTTPNPRVGCVIVRDGQVIGAGWHAKTGGPHAEVVALNDVAARGLSAVGATAYVTLEPCSHTGRTPPCAQALIRAGVARVVAAMQDPNPLVAGQGLAQLHAAGIKTACGLLGEEAHELNIGFVARMTRGKPWVRLKIAASLDGKTALQNGVSQWITSPASRKEVHQWRARSCAVLTGIGTVLADNPQLNVRGISTPRQPFRVIVDSQLQTPPDADVMKRTDAQPHVLIACATSPPERRLRLESAGAEVLPLPNQQGQVDLPALCAELGRRGMNEILVEAGARLNGALISTACVDELLLYQAPMLLGDSARGMWQEGKNALTDLAAAPRLNILEHRIIAADPHAATSPQEGALHNLHNLFTRARFL